MSDDKPTLTPVQQNPWYILATLAGEQTGDEIDWDLHQQNQRFWNRWATQRLNKESIAKLIESGAIRQEDREAKSIGAIEQAATARGLSNLPEPTDTIDFSNTKWPVPAVFQNFYFPASATFECTIFSDSADFESATFSDSADFESATFSDSADFESATFSDRADFHSATFSNLTDFRSATFSNLTDFRSATFSDRADFHSATFSNLTDFRSATFSDSAVFREAQFASSSDFRAVVFESHSDFSYTTFSGTALFSSATFYSDAVYVSAKFLRNVLFEEINFHEEANFNNVSFNETNSFLGSRFFTNVPSFFGAKLNSTTILGSIEWPSRPDSLSERKKQADRYEYIKLQMDSLGRHNDAIDFLAFEMIAGREDKRVLFKEISWLFMRLSNYGQSLALPVMWLVLLWASFAPFYYTVFFYNGIRNFSFQDSYELSAASLAAFVGVRIGAFPYSLELENIPFLVKIASSFESVVGGGLVFLMLLTLRNWFKIK